MLVIPAIDLMEGRCVRLRQGQPERVTVYRDNPVAIARQFEEQGAKWLHVVDLDAALAMGRDNREVTRQIAQAVGIPIEVGGGLRSWEMVNEAFSLGAARVILGTVAVTDPDFVSRTLEDYGAERIAVGIDTQRNRVAIRGWTQEIPEGPISLAWRLKQLGVARVIYTEVQRDGTLEGPNFCGIEAMARQTGLRVIASGGVASLEDLRRLKPMEPLGLEGVIIGKALYEGRIDLPEALRVAGSEWA